MSIPEDMGLFFTAEAGFTVQMTRESDGLEVRVIYNSAHEVALGMRGRRLAGVVDSSVGATLAVGDVLVSPDGERLEIVRLPPPLAEGMASVTFASLGHQVDIYALDGPLRVVYLDQAYPLYPAIDAPGQHDPEFTYVSSGPSKRHALVIVGPLSPSVIPANARIDWAMLFVASDAPYPSPRISVHDVLQPVITGQLNWNRYATGHNWSEAGCSGLNVDYGENEYTFRNGLPAGSVRLLNSQEAAARLDANKAGLVPFLIRASGSNATARFYSELGDNGGNRPLLRLRYTVPRV